MSKPWEHWGDQEHRDIRETLNRLEAKTDFINDQLFGLAMQEEEEMATEQETLAQIATLNTAFDNNTKSISAIATETAAIRAGQTPGAIPQSVTDALTALGAKDAAIQAALDAEVAADASTVPASTPTPVATPPAPVVTNDPATGNTTTATTNADGTTTTVVTDPSGTVISNTTA